MANNSANKAKTVKNDEFYTRRSDIENELKYYKNFFHGKKVYLNCDDHNKSKFWAYLNENILSFGLKALCSTSFKKDGKGTFALTYCDALDKNGKPTFDSYKTIYQDLKGDGDFRSEECLSFLKHSDIIITNPPFSLFRELLDIIVENKKDFLLIGNKNAIGYKKTVELIKEDGIRLGVSDIDGFDQPEGDEKKDLNGLCYWFTNMEHGVENPFLVLDKKYNEKDYPKYEGFDAINVDKTKDIPFDYDGVMGVPVSFFKKFNKKQFGFLGAENFCEIEVADGVFQKPSRKISGSDRETFKRLWIKRIKS